MSELSKSAKEIFLNGANCAQAVLVVFCEKYGMKKDMALAVTNGFGGGMKCGEVCGAVSGAIAVIGLKNSQNKAVCAAQTTAFTKKFKAEFSYLRCKDLPRTSREECGSFVAKSVEILEEMGY